MFGEPTVIPLCEHVFVYKTDQSSFGGEPATRHPWPAIHVPIADPTGWTASEIHAGLRALERIRRETEAATAVLIAALPETRDSVTSLARETGISTREARRRRDIAAVAGAVPGALALLGSGIVSGEHVAALMPAIGKAGVGELAVSAVGTSPEDFVRAVEQFRLAGEHGEDTAQRQRALRRLRFFKGPEGMVGINGLLAPIDGATLQSVLTAILDARYRLEHPERAAVLGGHGGDTYEQRMADALLEITGITPSTQAKPAAPTDEDTSGGGSLSSGHDPGPFRDADVDPGGGVAPGDAGRDHGIDRDDEAPGESVPASASVPMSAPPTTAKGSPSTASPSEASPNPASPTIVKTAKPAVIILFDVDKFEAELLGQGPLPVTASLFDRARNDLYYCFQNMHGEILKFGRARRDPTPIQRLAVIAHDRHCIYPGCFAPPDRCAVHHLNEWLIDQGFTDVEVLGLFCHPHHRHLHLNNLVAFRESDRAVTIRDRRTGAIVARATVTKPP